MWERRQFCTAYTRRHSHHILSGFASRHVEIHKATLLGTWTQACCKLCEETKGDQGTLSMYRIFAGAPTGSERGVERCNRRHGRSTGGTLRQGC